MALGAHVAPVIGSRALAQVAQDRDGIAGLLVAIREANSASWASSVHAMIMGVMNEAQRSGKISSHRLGGLGVRQSVTG
ncbi:MAG TPA: hypothetical protein VH307_05370 [Streptosporangiaceae bacterium]|nr:hypothetical protein [Streptosporangiaceae bacterium]